MDKGYPIVMGEYGANAQSSYSYHETYRGYWLEYITSVAVKHGVVPFYWDNASTSDGGFALFNRTTGVQPYPHDVDSIMRAFKSSTTGLDDAVQGASGTDASLRRGTLSIRLEGESTGSPAVLLDAQGRSVATFAVSSGTNRFDVGNLRPGIYFLRVPTASGEYARSLLKPD